MAGVRCWSIAGTRKATHDDRGVAAGHLLGLRGPGRPSPRRVGEALTGPVSRRPWPAPPRGRREPIPTRAEATAVRIKMLKRQMFGRAGIALLRKRVLLAS
jgi:hypothetical protein